MYKILRVQHDWSSQEFLNRLERVVNGKKTANALKLRVTVEESSALLVHKDSTAGALTQREIRPHLVIPAYTVDRN
jgi:hypothetical protein